MKRFAIIAMAAVALLCGCQKETINLQENNEGKGQVFTATMEPEMKATLDGMAPSWEAGDRISINGVMYQAETDGTSTTFVAVTKGQEAEGDTYKAYFPANLYDGTTAKLPAIQTYKAGKFDMPMYAYSTNTTLAFKNLCAVLAIKVTSDDITTLKSIKVASYKKMNGTFTVDASNKAVLDGDGTNAVVLESSEPLTLDETGTTFYIAIPAQEYKYLNIFLSSDGTTYIQAMATKKADGLGEIARSKMFSIDYARNATKLWAGKLFFADCNIGATSATEYGGYYTWGGITDKGTDYNTGTESLSGDTDTATKLWGSNWRMPTSDELTTLNGLGSWDSTKEGLQCTSTAYPGNSVFLPAAQGGEGYYWSSTPNGSYAYDLYFVDLGIQTMYYDVRSSGCSVRAVLEEEEVPTFKGTAKATINGSEVDVNWVQLWENGPKFAEFNVGVTDGKAESYGGYYCWGKAIDQDSNGTYNNGMSVLTGTDDTATNLWGSNWRMPTSAELRDLIDNCDVEWTTVNSVKGRKFTGKDTYESNSIFLPVAGTYNRGMVWDQGDFGYYWSSTPDSDAAYDLFLDSVSQSVDNIGCYFGCSVRAVLNE